MKYRTVHTDGEFKVYGHWKPIPPQVFHRLKLLDIIPELDFNRYQYLIHEKVYTILNDDFKKALEEHMMWMKLKNDRI